MPPNSNQNPPTSPELAAIPQQPAGLTPQTTPTGAPPLPPTTLTSDPKPKGPGKMLLILGAIVLLLVVIAGGAYLFLRPQTPPQQPQTSSSQSIDDLQSELDGETLTDPDSEFAEVDQDLQNL